MLGKLNNRERMIRARTDTIRYEYTQRPADTD